MVLFKGVALGTTLEPTVLEEGVIDFVIAEKPLSAVLHLSGPNPHGT